jgi:hypothetical protein
MERLGRHRPLPLGHKDVGGCPLFALQAPQRAYFVAPPLGEPFFVLRALGSGCKTVRRVGPALRGPTRLASEPICRLGSRAGARSKKSMYDHGRVTARRSKCACTNKMAPPQARVRSEAGRLADEVIGRRCALTLFTRRSGKVTAVLAEAAATERHLDPPACFAKG